MKKRLDKITNLYWYLLENTKYHERYVYYSFKKTSSIVYWLDLFQAFVSCGSVAAWTIWEKLDFLWAALIAISQFITALKSYIPYYKRKINLQNAYIQLSTLCQHMEYDWCECFLKITDKNMITNDLCDNVDSLYKKYYSDFQKIINNDPNDFIKEDETIEKKAKAETRNFLQKFCK